MYKSYLLNISEYYKDHHKVYTDTSKTPDGVGISIILKNHYNRSFKLPNIYYILYMAEVTAILDSASYERDGRVIT